MDQRIDRLLIKPMMDRGWMPPKGASVDVLATDYSEALAKYPDPVVSAAFRNLVRSHKYRTWPTVSEFLEAARDHYVEPHKPGDNSKLVAYARSRRAWAYVEARETADGGSLIMRGFHEGCRVELRDWLFDRACRDLRAGKEPHIPNDEVERFFSDRSAGQC